MSKTKRVLILTEVIATGGIMSHIMEIYRNIDREKVQFDFLATVENDGFYSGEISKLKGNEYMIPFHASISMKDILMGRYFQFIHKLKELVRENNYECIDIHIASPGNICYVVAARLAGVCKIIVHAHSPGNEYERKGPFRFKVYSQLIYWLSDYSIACSRSAAEFAYGKRNAKDIKIENNGISLERFKYNEEIRKDMRKKLDLEGRLVLGTIGRLCYVKNQKFIISMMPEIIKRASSAILLIIGDGEDRAALVQLVKKYSLEKQVIFFGNQDKISDFLQVMDIFLFPSFTESFGIAALEAQASGLKVIASDKVPAEVNVSGKVIYLPLDDEKKWIESIIENVDNGNRNQNNIGDSDYDIMNIVLEIQQIYLSSNKKEVKIV